MAAQQIGEGQPNAPGSPYNLCPGYPNCDVNLIAAQQRAEGQQTAVVQQTTVVQQTSAAVPAAQPGSPYALCPGYPNCDTNLLAAQQASVDPNSPYALCPGYPNCDPNLLAAQQQQQQLQDPNLQGGQQQLYLISGDDEGLIGGPDPSGYEICPNYPYCEGF